MHRPCSGPLARASGGRLAPPSTCQAPCKRVGRRWRTPRREGRARGTGATTGVRRWGAAVLLAIVTMGVLALPMTPASAAEGPGAAAASPPPPAEVTIVDAGFSPANVS